MAPLSWFTKSTLKYTPAIVELMVISVVLRLLGLVQPFVFQTLIDRVLPFQREATLMLILVFLIGTALFTAALGAISGYLHNHMANSLTMEMGGRIFSHVLRLPLRLQQKYHVGETLSRINEIGTIRAFLTGTVSNIILDVLFAVIYLGALFAISPSLAAIVLIMVPLQAIVFSIIGPFIRARLQQSFLAGSAHQTRLVEGFSNIITLKALASEKTNNARFQETLNDSVLTGFRVAKLNILNGTLSDFLSNVTVICIIFFGARQVFTNQITLGELIAFHLIADKVSGPVHSLTTVWEQWQGLRIARLRLGDFLNAKTEDDIAKSNLDLIYPVELTLNDIHFGYGDYHVIAGFSGVFGWQKPTVIVGPSGCGKSTLAKIMCGLYSPSKGIVAINGHNITDFDVQSVRHQIAYVEQEPTLFSGTIRGNMKLVKADATDDEIDEVLKICAAYEFVMGFPHGLDTEVGERGRSLSGGQRQRLALARSLLTKPKLLILDEPTSALDDDATQIVVETLKLIAKSTTLIVITHKVELFGEDVTYIDMAEDRNPHVS